MIAAPTAVRVHHSALVFDREYQRAIDPNRVRRLIEEFQSSGLGSLTISLRTDGRRVVVDGQHRVAAVRTIGYEGKLPCNQYTGLSLADEARMFLLLNNTKQVQAIDKFRARVMAEDETATRINTILTAQGWTAKQGNDAGHFGAVAAAEKVYEGAGVAKGEPRPDLLAAVINAITAAWGHDTRGVHNLIVGGLGQFFARYGDDIDRAKLVAELAKLTPHQLIGKANALKDARGGTAVSAVAEVVTGLHNKGRRTSRLPDWRWSR
ncbi:MAG TPA: DUF6551 family protein [Nocardioidaceae bacterium]|nr:DUF6551 family protein [Nocardioidaceae bacterium]